MNLDEHLWLFNEGRHNDLHQFLGAHAEPGGGYRFAVWAPAATSVAVVGDFNGWAAESSQLSQVRETGVWVGCVESAHPGNRYKFHVETAAGTTLEKADPFGAQHEEAPDTASVLVASTYQWSDARWLAKRTKTNPWQSPISIYEMHLGSWRDLPDDEPLFRGIAGPLCEYLKATGYTHVELLPVMEHPFYGSWGYQVTGYFAPTSRYGQPDDLRYLIDELHQAGIGVILDWVPAHFPADAHGLAEFDGTHLYEHADPKRGWHPDWQTHIFNYDRHEVRAFLRSSAMYWLDEFHIDGLRVDAVASMLYLDYSRDDGEWIPNEHGGNENYGAISLMREINEAVHARHPHTLMIAEESTAWSGVSRPTDQGGLGFGFKWDMGWMHDTLKFLAREPIHRGYHHDEITFRSVYAFSENFVLALSHDEVVHLKGSIPQKMPGDQWQQYANVRLLYGLQWAQPGKKLLFMGMDFAQWSEWNHEAKLEWLLLNESTHRGILDWVSDLNAAYKKHPSLYKNDLRKEGVDWSQIGDSGTSVMAIVRYGEADDAPVLAIANLTPTVRRAYRVGVPVAGRWREVLNSDSTRYGGSDVSTAGRPHTEAVPVGGHAQSLAIDLPPLSVVFWTPWGFKPRG
jgi:1,4-alpha-glucan branching enzyme